MGHEVGKGLRGALIAHKAVLDPLRNCKAVGEEPALSQTRRTPHAL